MNSFIKNNKQFFSLLLGLLLNSSLYALTFRNEPLTNFIEPGKVLCAGFPANSFVILELENDNFDIRGANINKLDDLQEVFQEVMDKRSGASFNSKFLNMSGNILNYNSSYLGGRENIDLQAKTSLKFNRCLFESPLISITGNKMSFIDSFLINPEVLNIIIDHPGSDYEVIQILFYSQPENPTVISGEIDLNDNDLSNDEIIKHLIISNVKEVRVQFIWNQNLSENLESTPEDLESTTELTLSVSSDEDVDADALTSSESLRETLEETIVVNLEEEAAAVNSDEQTAVVNSDEEIAVVVSVTEETAVVSQNEEKVAVSANSRSRSVTPGFVARYYQKIIAFSEKYIRPYFLRK